MAAKLSRPISQVKGPAEHQTLSNRKLGSEARTVKSPFHYPNNKKSPFGMAVAAETEMSKTFRPQRSTLFERFLLMSIVVVLPLQAHIPTFLGGSIVFIMFACLAAYVLLWRPRTLLRTLQHPVLLAGYALVGIGLFVELAHGNLGHQQLGRIAFMIVGAALVASLCRDRRALLFNMYGYLLAGVWLSVLFFLTSYGTLSTIEAGNFQEASQLRSRTLSEQPLTANANSVAFYIAQSALVAVILSLTAKAPFRRYLFLGLGIICFVGTFLPMSRSGIVILIGACAVVAHAFGIMQPKVLITVGVLTCSVLVFIPDSVFSRFVITADTSRGTFEDSRARVYMAVIEHLPEYVLTGVGVNDFYDGWGVQNGLVIEHGGHRSGGSHNCFAQVTLYWGMAGLVALLTLVWQSYRHLPSRCGRDPLKLCVLGLAVAALGLSFFVHNIYAKEFSLALGAVVGANIWIWPKRVVQSASNRHEPTGPPNQRPLAALLNPIQSSPRRYM